MGQSMFVRISKEMLSGERGELSAGRYLIKMRTADSHLHALQNPRRRLVNGPSLPDIISEIDRLDEIAYARVRRDGQEIVTLSILFEIRCSTDTVYCIAAANR